MGQLDCALDHLWTTCRIEVVQVGQEAGGRRGCRVARWIALMGSVGGWVGFGRRAILGASSTDWRMAGGRGAGRAGGRVPK